MRFDLTDLRLFLHVVEAGSITHGAGRMHLAIAAASTRIRDMEAALGTPLLNRERQGVQPTEAGRTLLHHARVMLQQAERMREDLAEYADGLRGQEFGQSIGVRHQPHLPAQAIGIFGEVAAHPFGLLQQQLRVAEQGSPGLGWLDALALAVQ